MAEIRCCGVDVGVICVAFAERIVRYVESLVAEIIFIDDTVCVVAHLPDFAWEFLADGEREAALDELSAAIDGLVGCWGKEDVDVIGHDGESVEVEFSGVAIAEEGGDEELCVCGALEDSAALVGESS